MIIRLSALILAVSLIGCANFRTYTAEERSERLQKGEVLAYLKNIDGTKLSIGEAQAIIDAPPARVWNAVTDYNHQGEIGPRTKKVEITKIEGDWVWVDLVLDSPWPIADREFTLKVGHDRTNLKTNWELVEGNIVDSYGSWNIEPVPGDPNSSLVTYTLLYDDGSNVPRFIVNTFSIWGVRKIMKLARGHVHDPIYDKPIYSISIVERDSFAYSKKHGQMSARPNNSSPSSVSKDSSPFDEETIEILR